MNISVEAHVFLTAIQNGLNVKCRLREFFDIGMTPNGDSLAEAEVETDLTHPVFGQIYLKFGVVNDEALVCMIFARQGNVRQAIEMLQADCTDSLAIQAVRFLTDNRRLPAPIHGLPGGRHRPLRRLPGGR